jgi:tRNA pseudouridine55 synthase
MATGVLPLMLGKYTRLAQFFGSLEKTYTGTIRFGFATDTYDAEGQTVGDCVTVSLTLEEVRKAAEPFQGEIEQTPPPFSAKKTGGKRAYQLARAGEMPKLKAARITIKALEITALTDGAAAAFSMTVSAGGYVRSVAHEMGLALGCGAHLASLRRVAAGPFAIEEAISLSDIEAVSVDALEERMPHPRTLLPELPSVTADAFSIGRLRNGAAVNLPEFTSSPTVKIFEGQRNLIAIGRRVAGTLFQPVVVLV